MKADWHVGMTQVLVRVPVFADPEYADQTVHILIKSLFYVSNHLAVLIWVRVILKVLLSAVLA